MKTPKVVVLILSYNGKALLEDSISSYLANDYPNFEVVVIDNGSTDGTEAYVHEQFPEAKVLRTAQNRGYSGGFNFGLEHAFNQLGAAYALITNNDIKADSLAISSLVEVASRDQKIGFVTGKVYFFDQPDTFQTTGFKEIDKDYWLFSHRGLKEVDEGQYETVEELEFSDDVFMLASREMYQQTKGYNLDFHIQVEQFEWQMRAKKLGFSIYFAPGAKIWHKVSMTIGKTSAFKTYYDVRNNFVVRLKHKNKDYLKRYFQWYLRNLVIRPVIVNTAKLKWNHSINILSGFFSAVGWGIKNGKIGLRGFK